MKPGTKVSLLDAARSSRPNVWLFNVAAVIDAAWRWSASALAFVKERIFICACEDVCWRTHAINTPRRMYPNGTANFGHWRVFRRTRLRGHSHALFLSYASRLSLNGVPCGPAAAAVLRISMLADDTLAPL